MNLTGRERQLLDWALEFAIETCDNEYPNGTPTRYATHYQEMKSLLKKLNEDGWDKGIDLLAIG
jgi:hypothetical protein